MVRHLDIIVMVVHLLLIVRDENIRYIRRYISDISDIGDVRHDIDDDRYITDISILDRYIVEISSMWHTRALV